MIVLTARFCQQCSAKSVYTDEDRGDIEAGDYYFCATCGCAWYLSDTSNHMPSCAEAPPAQKYQPLFSPTERMLSGFLIALMNTGLLADKTFSANSGGVGGTVKIRRPVKFSADL